MLANTFCNVPVDILSTVRWMLAWSSCSVCVVDLNTQDPWDAPIKRSLGGLSPRIVETTICFKWGVQETQIPSKPWVAWLFEHPVLQYKWLAPSHPLKNLIGQAMIRPIMELILNLYIVYGSVSQPVVCVPWGVRGRFRRGTLKDIKNKKLCLFYHILSLSHFNFFIVSISTVCIPFIIKYVCHTVINEFVFSLLLRYEHIIL
jgi:hypothetical protein